MKSANNHTPAFSVRYEPVSLSRIRANDRSFRINTNESYDFLAENIRDVGLLQPPILQRIASEPDFYRIICGFRRVWACMETAHSEITAGIVESGTPPLIPAQIAVSGQIFQGPLNPIEISNALDLFGKFADGPSSLADLARKSGLPDNQAVIEKLRSFSGLSDPIRNAVAGGIIPIAMASELVGIKEPVRTAVADIFIALRPGLNKQRDILTLIQEISAREDIPITEILAGPSIQAVLNDPSEDGNRKIKLLRTHLRQRRYPELTRSEKQIKSLLDTLPKYKGVDIIPPPYMEGPNFTIRLQFRNKTELDQLLTKLPDIAANPLFKELLDYSDI